MWNPFFLNAAQQTDIEYWVWTALWFFRSSKRSPGSATLESYPGKGGQRVFQLHLWHGRCSVISRDCVLMVFLTFRYKRVYGGEVFLSIPCSRAAEKHTRLVVFIEPALCDRNSPVNGSLWELQTVSASQRASALLSTLVWKVRSVNADFQTVLQTFFM